LVTEKRKRDEENRERLEKERKQREKEEQKRQEEAAKKKREEEEKLKKLLEKVLPHLSPNFLLSHVGKKAEAERRRTKKKRGTVASQVATKTGARPIVCTSCWCELVTHYNTEKNRHKFRHKRRHKQKKKMNRKTSKLERSKN
jgi:hypothetical protein